MGKLKPFRPGDLIVIRFRRQAIKHDEVTVEQIEKMVRITGGANVKTDSFDFQKCVSKQRFRFLGHVVYALFADPPRRILQRFFL